MTATLRLAASAALFCLAACGGGGGGAPAAVPAPPPTPTPPTTPATSIAFVNASVHDPSVIKTAGSYYVFGSHLAAAKTPDLMNWTKVADGVTSTNPLFNNVLTELAETFAWAQVTDLWAPDVVQLPDGKFYMYYNACKGDSPRSALGVAVADRIDGPYTNKKLLLKSGMWGLPSEDGTIYDARVHPNVVDPATFLDQAGKLWMVYGSYSGGIFIMGMDKATGLPLPGQGYGKHLMGGNHSRIEGAYVMYSPQSQYYYLFTSFGGLDANGAYNMRVARAKNADGPYLDAKGTDMATVKSNPSLPLFDDASIAPHAQKLMGNFQFPLAAGESGTPHGYVSAGHNSAYYEAATGQHFLVFHTRFPNRGEQHEIRVHEMFINADGWPVVAPFRYAPLSKNATALSAEVGVADVAGSYQMVNHGKDISATIKNAENIRLAADGTVSGAFSGSWKHLGSNKMQIVLASGTYGGVLSRQWHANANAFVVTFTAQSAEGVSVWGVRSGN